MTKNEMSPELKALLNATPVLSESDLEELAEANRALSYDPEFIADCMKGDFINDILIAMKNQGLNKSQLAKKWGKSRQYLNDLLDEEKSRNFTIDTIVSLSMMLGLKPQRITFKKMKQCEPSVEKADPKSATDPSCRYTPEDSSHAVNCVAEPKAAKYSSDKKKNSTEKES